MEIFFTKTLSSNPSHTQKKNTFKFEKLPEKFKTDGEIIWSAIKNGQELDKFPIELRKDLVFMKKVIEATGKNVEYVMGPVNDKDFIRFLVNHNSDFECMSDELKNDLIFMQEIVKENAKYYIYASNTLKQNKELILSTLNSKANGHYLDWYSPQIKNDPEFVHTYIDKSNDDWGFFIKDKDITEKTFEILVTKYLLKYPGHVQKYMEASRFGFRKDILKQCLSLHPNFLFSVLHYPDCGFERDGLDLFDDWIKVEPKVFEKMPKPLQNDEKHCLKLIKLNELCYPFFSDEMKKSKHIYMYFHRILDATDEKFDKIKDLHIHFN
jgi:hypothetical protein